MNLEDLDDDSIGEICKQLPIRDLGRFVASSRRYREVCRDEIEKRKTDYMTAVEQGDIRLILDWLDFYEHTNKLDTDDIMALMIALYENDPAEFFRRYRHFTKERYHDMSLLLKYMLRHQTPRYKQLIFDFVDARILEERVSPGEAMELWLLRSREDDGREILRELEQISGYSEETLRELAEEYNYY